MEFEEVKNNIIWIKEERDRFKNLIEQGTEISTDQPIGEEITKWCKTVIERGEKVIKNTSYDKKEYKGLSDFKNLFKNSMALTVDLSKLIDYFDSFYDKIEDRVIEQSQRALQERQRKDKIYRKRKGY